MAGSSTALVQAAFIVNDLDEAIRRWIDTARVGPFFVIRHTKVENILYRGAPSTLDFSGALAQAGPLQIELIQQHSDTPSAYRDMYAKGKEGFHHVCMMTDDFDAELARHAEQGSVAATQGSFGDMRFAYIDTRAQLGHMTEVVEDRTSIRELFKVVADASASWNGEDPIRYL